MRSLHSPDTIFTSPREPTQYRCLGIIKGIYKPSSPQKPKTGTFIFENGPTYPCYVSKPIILRLVESEDPRLGQPQSYRTWIKTNSRGLITRFQLKQILFNCDPDSPFNLFNLRGAIAEINSAERTVKIAIARNKTPPPSKENQQNWQPFLVKLEGSLPPSAAIDQFWEIYARWQSDGKLVIESASYVAPISTPKLPEVNRDKSSGRRLMAEGGKKQGAISGESTDSGETADSFVEMPSDQDNPIETAPQITKPQTTPTKTTTGRLEIAIKINTFPDDVKTLDNKWQQFSVDCDGQIVSITVKPKVFKKLEQARANSAQWVAAISGKMGTVTADGFELEQPSIQVFERKPKNPDSGK